MTYESTYEFMYMKNIMKSYLKSFGTSIPYVESRGRSKPLGPL